MSDMIIYMLFVVDDVYAHWFAYHASGIVMNHDSVYTHSYMLMN